MTSNTLSYEDVRYAQSNVSNADQGLSNRELDELPVIPQSPIWEPSVEQALEQLQRLPLNWDSQGGGPVAPDVAIRAEVLLGRTLNVNSPAPLLAPLNTGGVFVAWRGETLDVELEIETERPSWLTIEDSSGDASWDGPLDHGGFVAFSRVLSRLGT